MGLCPWMSLRKKAQVVSKRGRARARIGTKMCIRDRDAFFNLKK